MHVLFVCTGNTCRSPTAERLAAAYAARFRMAGLTTNSAGTCAVAGHSLHRDAAVVLESLGGNASGFVARQITTTIASDADLILTMTIEHRASVLELAPHQLRRTFTLSEAARLALDHNPRSVTDLADLRPRLRGRLVEIPDPIGRNPAVFAAVGAQIAELLPPILQLCRRA